MEQSGEDYAEFHVPLGAHFPVFVQFEGDQEGLLVDSGCSSPELCNPVQYIYIYIFSPVALRAMASSLLRFLDHTRQRITVGRTPLDE